MKKYLLLTITSFMITMAVAAQDEYDIASAPTAPKWTPTNGYWVIKSNISTPKEQTVMFYTDEGTLIYSEFISGVKLDTRRPRILMKLKKALDVTMVAWEKQKVVRENEMIVVNTIRHQ